MENKKVKELRELAKEQGIKGYSRMKKAELIQTLRMVRKPKIKPKKLILNSISKESTKKKRLKMKYLFQNQEQAKQLDQYLPPERGKQLLEEIKIY